MAIFAIIKQAGANSESLAPAIQDKYPLHHYDLGNGVWLVAATGTARDISDRLGLTSGDNGSAVILETASYYGRANPAVWTWIRTNWGVGDA